LEEGKKLINDLKEVDDIYKINFAGGEPFLNKNLGAFVKHAKNLGFKTSIITNASQMTRSWLQEYGPYVD
jgi:MoaA/NifB/PqqE/SkfB family radical SAM enzyme